MGRIRPARRDGGDQDEAQSPRHGARLRRNLQTAARSDGNLIRLVARDQQLRPGILQVDAVDILAAVQPRARLPGRISRELVPKRPHGARQRGGRGWALLAVRNTGREEDAEAVVLQDHRLCPAPDRRPGGLGLARGNQATTAQLDRALGRRRIRMEGRWPRGILQGFYHAHRYSLRGYLLRAFARAPAGASDHHRRAQG